MLKHSVQKKCFSLNGDINCQIQNKFGKEMILGRWFDTYRGLELSSCIPFQEFSSGSVVNNLPSNARDARDLNSILVSGRALRGKWHCVPIFLLGNFHVQRRLVGCWSLGPAKSWMWLNIHTLSYAHLLELRNPETESNLKCLGKLHTVFFTF